LLRYDELVAEREEIENKVKNLYEKAIKDPELQKLAKQRERLISYYTGLVSTFGNPSDQNSVAYALLKLGESLNEFHKAQLREELKRAEEESIYWKDFENMRTLTNFWKGIFVEAPKNLFKLGKELVWPFRKTDENPFVTVSWDFEKIKELAKKTTESVLPGGIVDYFYRGGARIDFDIFNKPGFNVLKFAWYDAPLKLAELTLTGMNSLIKDLTTTLAYFSLDPDLAKYFFPDKSVEEEIKSYSDDFLRAKVSLAALAIPKYPKLKDFFELPKEERLKPKNIIKFLSVLGSGDYGEYVVQESKRALGWSEFEVKFRGKLEDFLPPELEDFKAEYLFVNRQYLNKELAPGTKILMPERTSFPIFLDFLDPSIRAELKKNKWTSMAMTAIEWLGFMRYTPACAFWVPATQMTHDLAAYFKIYSPLSRKIEKIAGLKAAQKVDDLLDFSTGMLDFVTGQPVPAKFRQALPNLVEMRDYLILNRVLRKFLPERARRITEHYAQALNPGELQGKLKKFLSEIDDIIAGSVKDPKLKKRIKEKVIADLQAFIFDKKLPREETTWRILHYAGARVDDIYEVIKTSPPQVVDLIEKGFRKMTEGAEYGYWKKVLLTKGYNKLNSKQRILFDELRETFVRNPKEAEARIDKLLKESRRFKIPLGTRAYTKKDVRKVLDLLKLEQAELKKIEAITKTGTIILNIPDGFDLIKDTELGKGTKKGLPSVYVFQDKKTGKNYIAYNPYRLDSYLRQYDIPFKASHQLFSEVVEGFDNIDAVTVTSRFQERVMYKAGVSRREKEFRQMVAALKAKKLEDLIKVPKNLKTITLKIDSTLARIARKYKNSLDLLEYLNPEYVGKVIPKGTSIKIGTKGANFLWKKQALELGLRVQDRWVRTLLDEIFSITWDYSKAQGDTVFPKLLGLAENVRPSKKIVQKPVTTTVGLSKSELLSLGITGTSIPMNEGLKPFVKLVEFKKVKDLKPAFKELFKEYLTLYFLYSGSPQEKAAFQRLAEALEKIAPAARTPRDILRLEIIKVIREHSFKLPPSVQGLFDVLAFRDKTKIQSALEALLNPRVKSVKIKGKKVKGGALEQIYYDLLKERKIRTAQKYGLDVQAALRDFEESWEFAAEIVPNIDVLFDAVTERLRLLYRYRYKQWELPIKEIMKFAKTYIPARGLTLKERARLPGYLSVLDAFKENVKIKMEKKNFESLFESFRASNLELKKEVERTWVISTLRKKDIETIKKFVISHPNSKVYITGSAVEGFEKNRSFLESLFLSSGIEYEVIKKAPETLPSDKFVNILYARGFQTRINPWGIFKKEDLPIFYSRLPIRPFHQLGKWEKEEVRKLFVEMLSKTENGKRVLKMFKALGKESQETFLENLQLNSKLIANSFFANLFTFDPKKNLVKFWNPYFKDIASEAFAVEILAKGKTITPISKEFKYFLNKRNKLLTHLEKFEKKFIGNKNLNDFLSQVSSVFNANLEPDKGRFIKTCLAVLEGKLGSAPLTKNLKNVIEIHRKQLLDYFKEYNKIQSLKSKYQGLLKAKKLNQSQKQRYELAIKALEKRSKNILKKHLKTREKLEKEILRFNKARAKETEKILKTLNLDVSTFPNLSLVEKAVFFELGLERPLKGKWGVGLEQAIEFQKQRLAKETSLLKKLTELKKKGIQNVGIKRIDVDDIKPNSLFDEIYEESFRRMEIAEFTAGFDRTKDKFYAEFFHVIEPDFEVKALSTERLLDEIVSRKINLLLKGFETRIKPGMIKENLDEAIKTLKRICAKRSEYISRLKNLNEILPILQIIKEGRVYPDIKTFFGDLWNFAHSNFTSEFVQRVTRLKDLLEGKLKETIGIKIETFKDKALKRDVAKIKIESLPDEVLVNFIEKTDLYTWKFPITIETSLPSINQLKKEGGNFIFVDLPVLEEVLQKEFPKALMVKPGHWINDPKIKFLAPGVLIKKDGKKIWSEGEKEIFEKFHKLLFSGKKIVIVGKNTKGFLDRMIALMPEKEKEIFKLVREGNRLITNVGKKAITARPWFMPKSLDELRKLSKTAEIRLKELFPSKKIDKFLEELKTVSKPLPFVEYKHYEVKRRFDVLRSNLEKEFAKNKELQEISKEFIKNNLLKGKDKVVIFLPSKITAELRASVDLLKSLNVRFYRYFSPEVKLDKIILRNEAKLAAELGISLEYIPKKIPKDAVIYAPWRKALEPFGKKAIQWEKAGKLIDPLKFQVELQNRILANFKQLADEARHLYPLSLSEKMLAQKDPLQFLAEAMLRREKSGLTAKWEEAKRKLIREESKRIWDEIKALNLSKRRSEKLYANRVDNLTHSLEMIEKYVFKINQPPLMTTSLSNLGKKIREKIFEQAGIKLYLKGDYASDFHETTLCHGLDYITKALEFGFKFVELPPELLTNIWIHSVLFFRPGWSLNNNIGDVSRLMLATRSFNAGLQAWRMYFLISASFLKKFAQDFTGLFLTALPRKTLAKIGKKIEIPYVKRIAQKHLGRKIVALVYSETKDWYKRVLQTKLGKTFRLKVAKRLVKPFIPVKKGLDRFNKVLRNQIKKHFKGKEMKKMLRLEKAREELERQGLDYRKILKRAYKYQQFFTPETLIVQNKLERFNWAYKALGGEKFERLFNYKRWGLRLKGDPSDLNFLVGGGYAGQYANPTLALKYYQAGEKLGYWQALKQKGYQLYVNTMLYHEMCENMRRLLCFDTLLSDRAMSIAIASSKT